MNNIKEIIVASLRPGYLTVYQLRDSLVAYYGENEYASQSEEIVFAMAELMDQGKIRRIAGSDKFVLVGAY